MSGLQHMPILVVISQFSSGEMALVTKLHTREDLTCADVEAIRSVRFPHGLTFGDLARALGIPPHEVMQRFVVYIMNRLLEETQDVLAKREEHEQKAMNALMEDKA